MVASRGLFRYRFDELLRPGRKFQRSFVNGQLLVMEWHNGSGSKMKRKRERKRERKRKIRLEGKEELLRPKKCSPTRFRKRKASPAASADPIEIAGASSAPT